MKVTIINSKLKRCAWLLPLILFAAVITGCGSDDPTPDPFVINAENSRIEGNFEVGVPMTATNVFVVSFTGGGAAIARAPEVNGISIPQTNVTLSGGTLRLELTGTPTEPGTHTLRLEIIVANVPNFVNATFTVTEDEDPGNGGPTEEGFDGGTGSTANPWLISEAAQLDLIRDFANRHFLLTADVDLADLTGEWVPIPELSGTIDGGGHSVYGLTHTSIASTGGFVTTLDGAGTIQNIAFRDVDITATAQFGTIVGIHYGLVENIVVTGAVTSTHTGGDHLGGISGRMNGGKLTNAFINLEIVSGSGMTGGAVGRAVGNDVVEISNITATGSIYMTRGSATMRVGGILARAEGTNSLEVRNNLVTMDISATEDQSAEGVGGIFGACNNPGEMLIIENKFAGTLTNVRQAGGISGAGPNVRNNLVVGRGTDVNNPTIVTTGGFGGGSAGAIVGVGKFTVNNNIARNVTIQGNSAFNRGIAGVASRFEQNCRTYHNVVQNILLSATHGNRIAGDGAVGTGYTRDNFSAGVSFFNLDGEPSQEFFPELADGGDPDVHAALIAQRTGTHKTAAELTQAFYTSLGFDFNTVWEMRNGVPYLRNVGYQGDIPTD